MTDPETMNKSDDLNSRKESLIGNLEECGISQQKRNFHFERQDTWDWDSNYSSQLNDGIKAVLSASTYYPPMWIESKQQTMFRKLKSKYKAIERAEKQQKGSERTLTKLATIMISPSSCSLYKQTKPQRKLQAI